MEFGEFSLLKMAQYLEYNLAIWSYVIGPTRGVQEWGFLKMAGRASGILIGWSILTYSTCLCSNVWIKNSS